MREGGRERERGGGGRKEGEGERSKKRNSRSVFYNYQSIESLVQVQVQYILLCTLSVYSNHNNNYTPFVFS